MRHLGSLLLAALFAPVTLVLTGRGLGGLAEVAAEAPAAEQTDYFTIVTSACATGLAGLSFALLTMARLAPLGPALAGAGYLVLGVWVLADPGALPGQLPIHLVGLDEQQFALAAAVAPLLAVPLLVTLFLPGRWRAEPHPAPPAPPPALAPPAAHPPAAPAPPLAAPPPAAPPPAAPPPAAPPPAAPPPVVAPPPPAPAAPPAAAATAAQSAGTPAEQAATPDGGGGDGDEQPTDVLPSEEPTLPDQRRPG